EYQRCRTALKEALDVEPSHDTNALLAEIRSQPVRRDAGRIDKKAEYGSSSPTTREDRSRSRRLRVGVLPFQVLSPAVERNLAFSLSQEIAAALARFRWFDVIAPSGAADAEDWPDRNKRGEPNAKEEIDYVVDGDLRKR